MATPKPEITVRFTTPDCAEPHQVKYWPGNYYLAKGPATLVQIITGRASGSIRVSDKRAGTASVGVVKAQDIMPQQLLALNITVEKGLWLYYTRRTIAALAEHKAGDGPAHARTLSALQFEMLSTLVHHQAKLVRLGKRWFWLRFAHPLEEVASPWSVSSLLRLGMLERVPVTVTYATASDALPFVGAAEYARATETGRACLDRGGHY